jgi:antitoxin (DNA-binding transcriptional repressor) of toxin-antitoxin stability system
VIDVKMTISEFERDLETLLASVKRGEHVVVSVGEKQFEIVPDQQADELMVDWSQYTVEQQSAIRLGWSPEMAKMLTDVNPDAQLEPDFLPPREMDDYYDPFADKEG